MRKGLVVIIFIILAQAISTGEHHYDILPNGDVMMRFKERDYLDFCAQREWDRLMTWYTDDTVKRCYYLGKAQLYPDSVYNRMVDECEIFEEYDCWFISSKQFYKEESHRKLVYKEAYALCEAATIRQQRCRNMGSDSKCPLDDTSCSDPVLYDTHNILNWPIPLQESEFCIQKLNKR